MTLPAIMQWLAGTWFVIASDAPIWLKGDKEYPTLNYTVRQKNNDFYLLDEVRYLKNDKRKTIIGDDHLSDKSDKAFIWRGKGMLFFVKSKWQVHLQDKNGEWAVIAYSKTLFTPEGVDILSRKTGLSESTMKEIEEKMKQDSALAPHIPKLRRIAQ